MSLNLKIARIKKGYKQKELAEKIGVSRYYLSNLENGKKVNTNIKIMQKLSEILEVSVQELFFSEEE
ncbi:helix-turn-helix transcriptional regulator [Metaclostridioides mangenotii]|uniref:Transcriptional regulator n=1 Tax=Metaclostridioides mangenotii TaxID=1540 RepID=A0ABS4E7V8_9FIRM|nr:helix-turn-helix transcriptional regulator [Clostridioides mangenotii]MBP1854026.1 putative transcriptional regulator [Clostridioides mangenotii]